MKNLSKITDPKDITTKEFVENAIKNKLQSEDLIEYTEEDVQKLWDQIIESKEG